MKQTPARPPDFFESLSHLLVELAAILTGTCNPWVSIWNTISVLAVAMGRAHSEAGMMRLLGCNASFCSQAIDRLVERGWLNKQPNPQGEDSRFQLTITRKGRAIYPNLQASFNERVTQKLAAAQRRAMAWNGGSARKSESATMDGRHIPLVASPSILRCFYTWPTESMLQARFLGVS